MENTTVSKHSVSFGLALAITCVVNALIVVVKEKSAVVMDGMRKITGHHWITHTVIVLVLFVIFALLFSRANGGQGMKITASRLINIVVAGVVISGISIVGFYLFAD